MQPYLPQQDPNPTKRAADLAKQRDLYIYDYVYLAPLPLAKSVPDQAQFSTRYITERLLASAELPANLLAAKTRTFFDPLDQLQEYEDLFPFLPLPEVAKTYQTDQSFAEQRLSGPNPLMIAQLSAEDERAQVLNKIPSAQADFEPLFNVQEELAAGNIYITDYTGHDVRYLGPKVVEGGQHEKGHKYLPKVRAFFRWRQQGFSDRGELAPIAIQIGTAAESPVYTPFDQPEKWLFAKLCVQVADANHHEMDTHLCRTHFVMEPFAVATARQLADSHPLNLLLTPHLRFMLANNHLGRERLINKKGPVDNLLAGTREESLALVKSAYKSWSIDQFAFPVDLKNRGMADTDRLPHYPYRDDGMLLWEALHEFVTDYLKHFYPTTSDLAQDAELQAWAKELSTRQVEGGAEIKGMPSTIDNLDKLAEIVTTIIFTCGPMHSAVNYTQYDYMAFSANMPLAAYSDPNVLQSEQAEITEAEILKLLPPYKKAAEQLSILFILSAYRFDQLGSYDKTYGELYDSTFDAVFAGTPVTLMLSKLQQKLYLAEQRMTERNRGRVTAYNAMKPSLVLNSISI
ncbi:lipoxygenase [filamentous cyanobacterium LEGE 11480]|uniref:Lipoxygenase n=1 Tax=Romeriopsis navalis LEGE 11480 TaxID=2777977 RepID=A0A928Z1F1_9CYAN|nr:lipoxygenase family protein [Romeriopsis navalis]MBE9029281.1 lipoxygenase [Romeriopsis navalis LEGE 11480]